MTGLYDWNPMPHKVDVRCPSCGGLAVFEFAEIVRIRLKKEVPFFQKSKQFDYEVFKDSCGHKWHGAVYYPGMHGGSEAAIGELPDGYEPGFWAHSRYQYRNHRLDKGSVRCTECALHRRHVLSWPEDAYFAVSWKNSLLWAFDRDTAVVLRDYILGSKRSVKGSKWSGFLLHVPSAFKKRGARERIVKQLDALLSA